MRGRQNSGKHEAWGIFRMATGRRGRRHSGVEERGAKAGRFGGRCSGCAGSAGVSFRTHLRWPTAASASRNQRDQGTDFQIFFGERQRGERHAVFSPFLCRSFLSTTLLQPGICVPPGVGLQSPEKSGILPLNCCPGADRTTVGTACGCESTRTHDKACRRTTREVGIPSMEPALPAKRN